MNVMEETSPHVGMPMAELCRRALHVGGFTSKPILGITDDSRQVRPGWLYVAIRGTRVDGHSFVSQAVAGGAAAVVVERSVGVPPGVIELIVPDSRQALARLMSSWTGLDRLQADRRLRVLGVTGTNGKSTYAFMTRELLRAAGFRTAMLGTVVYDLVGRQIPAPLTTPAAVMLSEYLVEAVRHGAQFATMEVSSISLDQRRTDGIDFEVAAFSNLTGDHLDYHGTMGHYFAAKKRLFDSLRPGATAVTNSDDPYGDLITADCRARVLRYGFGDRAELRADIIESSAGGTRFALHFAGRSLEMATPLAGRHNVYNAMAAAGSMLAIGLDLETIRSGLAAVRRIPGRLERVDANGTGIDVFVDYAHTDDALENVLKAVRAFTTGRVWCVFGCGGDRDRSKRPRMAAVAARLADEVVITSDNPRTEDPQAIIAEIVAGLPSGRAAALVEVDRAAAIEATLARAAPGDTVLIAGKGHEDYQIIGTEKIHFDDAEVAAGALKRRGGAP